jgi:DNA-binding NarL/FixJ family response regulator
MQKDKDCVRTRAHELYGMTEQEYLLDRIDRGYSARQIARELGFSTPAICDRLRLIANKRPSQWVPKEAA